MKKITFLFSTLLACHIGLAQSTSFEASEGYTLGNLSGQNGWTVFSGTPNIPIVTDSQSTDGTYSVKLMSTNGQANSGGFSPLFTSNLDAIISTDMYLTSTTGELSDTDFVAQSPSQSLLTSRVKFPFSGTVQILDDQGTGIAFVDTGEAVIRDAWFELKVVYRFSSGDILYYINNNLIYTGTVFGGTNVEQYILLFDNFESDAYFDNISYSDGTILSVDELSTTSFKHFYDKNSDVLTLATSGLDLNEVELYNVIGQKVINKPLKNSRETLDLSALQDGIYIAKVQMGNQVETVRFLKH